jgi:hypothetical protein
MKRFVSPFLFVPSIVAGSGDMFGSYTSDDDFANLPQDGATVGPDGFTIATAPVDTTQGQGAANQPAQNGTGTPAPATGGATPTQQGQGTPPVQAQGTPNPATNAPADGTPADQTPPVQTPTPQGDGTPAGDTAPSAEAIAQSVASATAVANHYIEKGILLPTAGKQYDLSTDAGHEELQMDTVRNHLASMVNRLPETQKQLAIAMFRGAEVQDLQQLLSVDATLPDYTKYDTTTAEHRNLLMQAAGRADLGEDATDEDITAYVAALEGQGGDRAKKIADAIKTRLVAQVNTQRAALTQTITAKQDEIAQQAVQQRNTTIELIRKTDAIANIPLPATSREALIDFMYKPGKDGKTPREAASTPQTEILGAYFLMHGFDVAKIAPAGKTQASILGHIAKAHPVLGTNTGTAATGVDATQAQLDSALDNIMQVTTLR